MSDQLHDLDRRAGGGPDARGPSSSGLRPAADLDSFIGEGEAWHRLEVPLDFVGEHVKDVALHCRWQWEPGDLAIWDERSTLHRSAADHWPQRRIIRRLEIDGDRPFYEPGAA